jgi:hypothetical protein
MSQTNVLEPELVLTEHGKGPLALKLSPHEAASMPDGQLQSMLLLFAEQATRLYAVSSKQKEVPERFIQHYCAVALMKLGFMVTTETTHTHWREWKLSDLDPDLQFFIDLVIYNPAEDGNPDNAKLRALVEFKCSPWDVSDDINRTTHLLEKVPKERAFGFVIACGWSVYDAATAIKEVEQKAAELRAGKVASRLFTDRLGNGYQFNGYVAGVPCLPASAQ